MSGTLFQLWKALPGMMLIFFKTLMDSVIAIFKFHIFPPPSKPLLNEVALVSCVME
jgi:hypothetical protein